MYMISKVVGFLCAFMHLLCVFQHVHVDLDRRGMDLIGDRHGLFSRRIVG